MSKKLIYLLPALFVLTLSLGVGAFPFVKSWHDASDGNNYQTSTRAGGGGIYGTGAAQDWGIKCSHCHIKGEGLIDVSFDVFPSFTDVGGEEGYLPGERYTITVNLLGEHRGLDNMQNGTPVPDDNRNGMVAVIENVSGGTAGIYHTDSGVSSDNCPSVAPNKNDATLMTTYVYGDCHGVLFTEHNRQTSWTFDWEAPAAGAGDVTIYWGVVDGDWQADSSLDDDVKEGTIRLLEGS